MLSNRQHCFAVWHKVHDMQFTKDTTHYI